MAADANPKYQGQAEVFVASFPLAIGPRMSGKAAQYLCMDSFNASVPRDRQQLHLSKVGQTDRPDSLRAMRLFRIYSWGVLTRDP